MSFSSSASCQFLQWLSQNKPLVQLMKFLCIIGPFASSLESLYECTHYVDPQKLTQEMIPQDCPTSFDVCSNWGVLEADVLNRRLVIAKASSSSYFLCWSVSEAVSAGALVITRVAFLSGEAERQFILKGTRGSSGAAVC